MAIGCILALAAAAVTNLMPNASASGRDVGWPESGEMALSFEQAKIKLGVRAQADGWRHVHTIPLGRDRILEAWERGPEEMTLMVWRIAPGRTGWSSGVTSKAGAAANGPKGKGNRE